MSLKLFFSVIAFFIIQIGFTQIKPDNLDKKFIKKMRKAGVVGMQLGFVNSKGSIWTGSYGIRNHITGVDNNDSTLFMIASCSKPITALAILKLYNDKIIDIDQDINTYLPFKVGNPNYPNKVITIRMLMAHTSSFQDNWDVLDPLYTTNEGGDSPLKLIDFTKAYFTIEGKYYDGNRNYYNEAPGTYWKYSNMGYALLGLIIEQASGKDFSSYMQSEIFEPLKMKNSFWFLKNIFTENIASPHVLPENKKGDIKLLKHYGFPDFPDGQLRTTTSDYLKFVRMILDKGKINGESFIDESIIKLFHTVQYPQVHKHQAVAWNYDEFENRLYYLLMPRLPSHTGGDPGVATVVSYDPDNNIAAVVYMNSPPVTFRGGKILYLNLPKRLLKAAKKSTI